ncbi:MAG: hypothetical protein U0802_07895 [Candidatus Binatia bacterium]
MIVRAQLDERCARRDDVAGAHLVGGERWHVQAELLEDLGEALQRVALRVRRGEFQVDPDVELAGDVGDVEGVRVPHQDAAQRRLRVDALGGAQAGGHGVEQAVVADADAGVAGAVADATDGGRGATAADAVAAAAVRVGRLARGAVAGAAAAGERPHTGSWMDVAPP